MKTKLVIIAIVIALSVALGTWAFVNHLSETLCSV